MVIVSPSVQFSSVTQSCPTLCNPTNRSTPGSLSITNSRSSLRLTSIKSVRPSSHLILCRPLLLLPPIPPSIRVFSNESTLRMRWPKIITLNINRPNSLIKRQRVAKWILKRHWWKKFQTKINVKRSYIHY